MLSTAFLRRPARVACIYQPFFSSLHHDAALAEYTDTPQYPEIIDVSREANKRRKKEAWHQKVTNLPSVEQKMMELNMPKYFGHWSCQLRDNRPTLLTTDFCRFATRTHVEEVERLPEHYYAEVWQQAEAAAGRVAGQVEQLIDLNFNTQLNRRMQDTPSSQLRRKTQNFSIRAAPFAEWSGGGGGGAHQTSHGGCEAAH
ncbi:hypothetical protein O3P69_004738 [Scylla paramamosain]|uniref:Uncharacterized protein n=1 Tax=Scylla paramamosain TaxID=85552 RepID=A0AAW0UCQ5_SCYPA